MGDKERFEAKVDRSGGPNACHPWTAYRRRDGYGRAWLQGKVRQAPRVAFFFAHGRWPEPCVLHRCDNPACCNPEHLLEGTMGDNNADMVAKGRQVVGESNGQSKLTEQAVRDIRATYALCRVTKRELADQYGVGESTIGHLLRGESWRHVEG